MKKVIIIALALVLVCAMLASCSCSIDLDEIAEKIGEIGEEIKDQINDKGEDKEPEIYEENGFRYQLNGDKTAYLQAYLLDEEEVTVPAEVKGCKVTKIEARAFYGKNMKKVTVRAEVTEIGESAFANCAKMEFIDLRKGLQTIGASSFEGTTALREIYFAGETTEWAAVQKGENWKPANKLTVHCMNADIKVD